MIWGTTRGGFDNLVLLDGNELTAPGVVDSDELDKSCTFSALAVLLLGSWAGSVLRLDPTPLLELETDAPLRSDVTSAEVFEPPSCVTSSSSSSSLFKSELSPSSSGSPRSIRSGIEPLTRWMLTSSLPATCRRVTSETWTQGTRKFDGRSLNCFPVDYIQILIMRMTGGFANRWQRTNAPGHCSPISNQETLTCLSKVVASRRRHSWRHYDAKQGRNIIIHVSSDAVETSNWELAAKAETGPQCSRPRLETRDFLLKCFHSYRFGKIWLISVFSRRQELMQQLRSLSFCHTCHKEMRSQ